MVDIHCCVLYGRDNLMSTDINIFGCVLNGRERCMQVQQKNVNGECDQDILTESH